MSGRVVHFEIPFDDGDRARDFYRDAFGWDLTAVPGSSYTLAETGRSSDHEPPGEPGFVNGGLMRRESPDQGPILVIEVDDVEAALARITGLGGSTILGRRPVPENGFAAYFKDVEGNIMGLWQPADAPG